jgi:surface antigen
MFAAVAALLALMTGSSQAAGLSFLGRDAIARFNEQDIDLMRGALGRALRSPDFETAQAWSNAATGAGGEITPLRAFERGARPCRELRVKSWHKQVRSEGVYVLCRRDGRWALASR